MLETPLLISKRLDKLLQDITPRLPNNIMLFTTQLHKSKGTQDNNTTKSLLFKQG